VNALGTWRKLSGNALGRWLFSRLVCFRAPYFGTISPVFDALEPGRAIARMRKRRKVQNHIGTVHAIAMANLCELVAGTLTEVSIPEITEGKAQDVVVPVRVLDADDDVVVTADITMYVSPRSANRARS